MKREDHLTVTVFGDHRASRSFLLPKNWIPKLGLLLCVMLGITVISMGLAIRYYRASAASQPWRLRELEETITELKRRAVAPVKQSTTPVETSVTKDATQETTPPANLGSPITSLKSESGLFTGIPLTVKQPPASQELPIEIGDLKAQWNTKTLDVYFSIRYISKDNGNQQGHIVILAWGTETLFSYPSGTLNTPGSTVMILPQRGEFFSVSRFREVKAKFGPVATRDVLKKVEILIFSTQNELLYHQILNAGQEMSAPATAEPVPTTAAKPNPTTAAQPSTAPKVETPVKAVAPVKAALPAKPAASAKATTPVRTMPRTPVPAPTAPEESETEESLSPQE